MPVRARSAPLPQLPLHVKLSRDEQKAIRQAMRMIKRLKRLPADLRFDEPRTLASARQSEMSKAK